MSADDSSSLDPGQVCLAVLARGTLESQRGNFEAAEQLFRIALELAKSAAPEEGRALLPLTLYSLGLLRLRQNRPDDSQKLREQATAQLESGTAGLESALFQNLMAGVLFDLGEYRRAIPFCEQAIELELPQNNPIWMAEMLFRAGQCYSRSGLRDHAAVPLRAAVKIFRNSPGDPRLPAALIALGNALRKNSPTEAESFYKEAAELHIAKGQMESATVPWVNLGILCSEQGRHAESLKHYQRVLRVREKSPSTPPGRLGTGLNNIANCYRRMEKFPEALEAVDRAIALLEPGGEPTLASAYGTRGLIHRDEGRDAEAVEWLRKAYAAHQRVPSPNLETVAEDLENEIAALTRLGRSKEAAAAEERLASVRATMKAVQPVDRDLSALRTTTEGAVLVELGFGTEPGSAARKRALRELMDRLREVVDTEQAGFFAGKVVIPENTTLMFYGADGEALFRAIEPLLARDPICAGATVTIRQGDRHRTVVLPSRVN